MIDLPVNKPCPACGRYKNRGITVDGLIIRNTKILLIKRGVEPFKGYWALPGGHIEWDEEAENTLKREVQEETGLHLLSSRLLNVYSKPERDPYQKITIAYIVEVDGEPKAGSDAKEFRWFSFDGLPEKLGFDHAKIISDYLMELNSP